MPKNKEKITLAFIFLISVFFRFIRIPELLHWTMDEDFWSYLPYNIATAYHFPAIGGHISGTGLYSGPMFIYLMALPAKIFSGNPLGFAWTVAAIGVLASILIYFVARKFFGQRAGIISAFLYSTSFLMAIFDRHYWNASLTPILSLFTLWFIYEIRAGKKLFAIPLAFVLSLAFHAHGTGMALLVFTLLSWIVFRLPLKNKPIIAAIFLFLILQLPLVFFDLRHNFLNTKATISYLMTSKGGTSGLSERVSNVTSGFISSSARLIYFPAKDLAIEQTLGLQQNILDKRGRPPVIIYIFLLGFFLFLLTKFKSEKNIQMSLLLIISTLLGLLIYKEKTPEYFYNPTFVPLFLLFGYTINFALKKKYAALIIFPLFFLFFVLNVRNILTVKHSLSYAQRYEAVKTAVDKIGNSPFSFNVVCPEPCQQFGGFRYLFTYLHHEPVSSYMDPNFLWLYENRLPKTKPVVNLIFYTDGQTIYSYIENSL